MLRVANLSLSGADSPCASSVSPSIPASLVPGAPEGEGVGSLLELPQGQIHVVLGGNRAGKTPFCRLLAGLPGCATGEVSFDGVAWDPLPTRQRPVALVYQDFVNYPHWTVYQNLASPCVAQGMSAQSIAERVQTVAAQLEIAALLDRLPAELSGGQQQRVAIGRALAKQAQLLIMDEPLVNLDYKLRESLELELLRILQSLSLTVIYTTRDAAHAISLADNLILLHDQKVVQVGPPMNLYRQPGSLLSANLLSEPKVNRLDLAQGTQYVRPEHVRLGSSLEQADQDSVNHILIKMQLDDPVQMEANGSDTFVRGRVADHPWVVKLPGIPNLMNKQSIELVISPADLLHFPGGEDG